MKTFTFPGSFGGGAHFDQPSYSPLNRIVHLTILVILLAANPAQAWRVVSFARVPGATTTMLPVNGNLWCGYSDNDSIMRVLNPADGSVTATLHAPEGACKGLAYNNGSYWFLGREHLYRLNQQGAVQATYNIPFAHMRGLTWAGGALWSVVTGDANASLVQFQPQGNEIRRLRVNVTAPGGIAWDGTFFWITDPDGGFIHQFDSSGRAIDIYPSPSYDPRAVSVIGGDLYLIDAGDDAETDVLYRLSLNEEPIPRMMTSGRFHEFGFVNARGGLDWNLAIYNIGGVDLQVDTIRLANGRGGFQLGQIPNRLTIRAGQYAIAVIHFTPPDYGRYDDTLVIRSNDPIESMIKVSLSGIGVFPDRVLQLTPDPINFGIVRAEPRRDGSRHIDLNVVNQGAFELTLFEVTNRIPEIFRIERPRLPLVIQPADTFRCRIWFYPHRGLHYLDTLVVRSNGISIWSEAILVGTGDAANYDAGSVLWESYIGRDGDNPGAIAVHCDLNGDAVREVIGVDANGGVVCINGFTSGDADLFWEQRFDGLPYRPARIKSGAALEAGVFLGSNPSGDVVFGTGRGDGAVYALHGGTGALLWRWSASAANLGSEILRVLAADDCGGDGAFDPVVLTQGEAPHNWLVRLEGRTGHGIWAREVSGASLAESSPDINGDGISDYLVASAEFFTFISGLDGSLLYRIASDHAVSAIFPLGSPNEAQNPLFIAAQADGGVSVIDIFTGQVVWSITEYVGIGQLGVIQYIDRYVGPETDWLAIGDVHGNILVVDSLATGHVGWGMAQQGELSSLRWSHPGRLLGTVDLLAGFANGDLVAYDGEARHWIWAGQAVASGSVSQTLAFDDVDYGGSRDVLVLTADGSVRCLSSGGDLAVRRVDDLLPVEPLVTLFPNPFNDRAVLRIDLPGLSPVTVVSYDVSGRQIDRIEFGDRPAGRQLLEITPSREFSTSGAVIFRIETVFGSMVVRGQYLR